MYHGLTGPDRFASLARTFTGHFHSHQTINQKQSGRKDDDPRGSVTYLGSPLQLSWADLHDEERGVVLFDPGTLEHELVPNPHAVGYTTADLEQVLDGQVDERAVKNKHVMLTGNLTHLKYVTGRDKLLSLGVRSVRKWTPRGFASQGNQSSFGGLGASVPASDAAVQPLEEPTRDETGLATTTAGIADFDPGSGPGSDPGAELRDKTLDLAAGAREYVESLDLDESLLLRRGELVRVGQRMIQACHEIADQDGDVKVNHQDFLDNSSRAVGTRTATELAGPSTHIFVAEPRTLTITNFLGIQNTITIDFQQDLPRGLTFLVGDNGSGKSTLVEAMAWCQFGRCIRGGLAVNDVVNDNVGKNCSVKLEFANGYAIERYRKHKIHKNRVVISLHGEPQPQLEHPDARTTQAAINELLGTDYETYVRTVVLSHESAASFLNSTPAQRRDLIEASLGLSMLDQCGQVSRLLLKDIDADVNKVEGKLEGLTRAMEYNERRFEDLNRTQKRLEDEAEEDVASLGLAIQDYESKRAQAPDPNAGLRVDISTLQNQIHTEQETLKRLKRSYAQMQERKLQKHAESTSWLCRLHHQLSQRYEAMATAHPIRLRRLFHAMEISILYFLLRLLHIFGLPKDGSEGTTSIQDHNREAAINGLRRAIDQSRWRLQSLMHEEKLRTDLANMFDEQLAQATQAQKACEVLQQQITMKQHEAATYKRLADAEQSSVHSLRLEHDALSSKLQELAANRELFDFWSSALAKRTRRGSSSSSPSSTTKATTNFRAHILVKSLSQLNALVTQVLMMLYDDTRHMHMATGMLRSLFDSESTEDMANTFLSGSVLDPTLAVNPSLAYNKRSSGERKRVDLALFFALLQLAQARSAHRAHYLLIDEVFDNLDKAGQAAVAKWCSVMSRTVVGWIVVITHSQSLVEQDLREDGSQASVITARMGQGGTELFLNGSRIGEDEETS
ncbi:P-loop containing nucleoside triphosphate hydrolase protein [Chaetomium sp. MPI-CAGE-AT-0009]|nr:P-loop containing nucleoside triphosphate hydrolase protein [Chaetomium sp. MPI-CAGE-AT-0009]